MAEEAGLKHRYTDFGKDFITVASYAVTYKDVFLMNYLYLLMHEWMIDEGYATRDDENFPETLYVQMEDPAAGTELWIRWRLQKSPAESKLWRYDLDVDVHVLAMKDVEVLAGGKKLKMNKAEVEVAVVANLIIDYEKAWEKHSLLKQFKNLIVKRVLKERLKWHRDQLYAEAYRFQEALKTYLKMETYLPEREFGEFWAKQDRV